MSGPNWQKPKIQTSKFLKAKDYITAPFTGVMESIYFSETESENPKQVVNIEFQGDKMISFYVNTNDSGFYWGDWAVFIESAEKTGIEVQEAHEDGADGVRLVDAATGEVLEHPTLTIRGFESGSKGDESQTVTYYHWGLLEKCEVTKNTPGATTTTTRKSKPKGQAPSHIAQPPSVPPFNPDVLLPLIESTPKLISELYTELDRKYKPNDLRAALDGLVTDGLAVKTPQGKYKLA